MRNTEYKLTKYYSILLSHSWNVTAVNCYVKPNLLEKHEVCLFALTKITWYTAKYIPLFKYVVNGLFGLGILSISILCTGGLALYEVRCYLKKKRSQRSIIFKIPYMKSYYLTDNTKIYVQRNKPIKKGVSLVKDYILSKVLPSKGMLTNLMQAI